DDRVGDVMARLAAPVADEANSARCRPRDVRTGGRPPGRRLAAALERGVALPGEGPSDAATGGGAAPRARLRVRARDRGQRPAPGRAAVGGWSPRPRVDSPVARGVRGVAGYARIP